MKRVTAQDVEWLVRHAEMAADRRLRARSVAKLRRKGMVRARKEVVPLGAVKDDGKRHVIVAPQWLDFDSHCDDTLAFISRIRRWVIEKRRQVFVDMMPCREITPDVALVLAAEIQRCIDIRQDSINGRNPFRRRPNRLLKDLGFHTLCGFRGAGDPPSDKGSLRYIRMESGNLWNTEVFWPLVDLVLGGKVQIDDEALSNDLLTGLNEAMLNVKHHAYKDESLITVPVSPEHLWWIAGYRDAEHREILFMFYDQGATIPATLPKKWPEIRNHVKVAAMSLLRKTVDGEMIAAAMDIRRTSASEPGRGHGLHDLRMLIDTNGQGGGRSNDSGSLRILSRQGSYIYKFPDSEEVSSLQHPLGGTLIVWSLVGSDKVVWANGI